MWFQQGGSTSHTSKQSNFRGDDFNWPPRSCDLTPLGLFLWGYLKEKVFATIPQTINELKEKIIIEFSGITAQLCKNSIRNYYKRLKMYRACRGPHLVDIVYHL